MPGLLPVLLLSHKKRYLFQRQHSARHIIPFLLFLSVKTVDAVCSNVGEFSAVLSALDQDLIKLCHEYADLITLRLF